MTNIVKYLFIFQQKTYKQNNTWLLKSADTVKTSSNFEKKKTTSEYESQINFRKNHQIS